MKKRRVFPLLLAATAVILFASAAPAHALQIVPECAIVTSAQQDVPGLNCVLETFGNIAKLILGISGSLALLMFVWGGFTILSSGGVDTQITKGKTMIRNAVIGLLIIFTAGYLIDYGMKQLKVGTKANLMNQQGWCDKDLGARRYVVDGQEICAQNCGQMPGYSCVDAQFGMKCFVGLCPEQAENIRCCQQ